MATMTLQYSNAIIIDGNTVNVESLNSRCINCILIKRISDSPTAKEKIEFKYKDKIEWNEICKILIKTSIYTKLREFQYKIIHNYLPVNHNLFKWKVSDSNRCSYCFNESETIEHLFYSCHIAVTFYCVIKEWCRASRKRQTYYSVWYNSMETK